MIIPPAKRRLSTASSEEPIFDPFPEPRTFPGGWDLSGMISSLKDDESESGSLPTSNSSSFLMEES
jgi:hypothetical protein